MEVVGGAPSWSVDGFDDLREIGRGGSATVYSARQIALDRRVAIKVLHAGLTDADSRRRFERECAVLGALADAPGIVAVHAAVFTSDGRGGIVMRLMEESLAETLQRTGPLDPARVRDIGVAACRGLGYAHDRGIVHRDVKPGNLLVAASGEVAVGDFDIASAGGLASTTVTNDSMSPPHAPPERLDGRAHGSAAGDIWALGSTLYTLLGDRQPFGTSTSPGGMAGLVQRVLHDPVPPLGRADVPPELEAVLRRALAKDPAERWPDMASMAAALEAVEIPGGSTASGSNESGSNPATGRDGGADPTVRPVVASTHSAGSEVTAGGRRGGLITLLVIVAAVVVAVVATVLIAFL